MGELESAPVLDALAAAYETTTAAVGTCTEAELMAPTRCAGWTVGDLLYHQLLDARRALRTFASPADGPPDVDDVSYWTGFVPGDADAAAHARHVRIVAAAYPPEALTWEWRETSAAAVRAGRACPYQHVTTQGHVLRTADFAATLTVEAAVHYLDLTLELPGAPEPAPAALALVRRVLDGLLGEPEPIGWDDRTYALKGTGRLPLTDPERALLGDRLPLFG